MNETVSAVIIANNEERNIRRCIESLAGVVDEVVVVDSGSTDRTEEICRSLGARWMPHAWAGYAAQKNFANQQATGRWILSLDADEALSEQLQRSIADARAAGLSGAFSFNRLTNYCGRWIHHCGWYPDTKVRLFPKESARWIGPHVHEELEFDAALRVHHLAGDLLHYSYYTPSDHLRRTEEYALLGARALHDRGRRGSLARAALSAVVKFLRMYFFQLGVLEGTAGIRLCAISAWGTWRKHIILRSMNDDEQTT